MAFIEFGEYTPDLPSFNKNGVISAKNVIPKGTSYGQFPGAAVYSTNALEGACQGAFRTRDTGGNAINFAGTSSKLYKLGSGTWSDVSIAGGYSTAADDRWEFIQFGSEIIALNYTDTMQTYTMGSSSLFADVTGSPPRARTGAAVRDFLVVGNTVDTDGTLPHRVRWAGIGTTNSWAVSSATQADFQNLDGPGGWVQRIVGGEYGVIFQERSITRMTYVGSPAVFQFDEVESNRGTPAPGSVVKIGNWIAYLGQDGFYIFDGQTSIPIGTNRVDKTFFADLDETYVNNIRAASKFDEKIIYWAYPGVGNTGGRCNKILMYNYSPTATKRWSFAEVDVINLFSSAAEGYTLEGLDTISTDIDSLSVSLDSKAWTSNTNNLSGFNSSHFMVNFNGDALAASIDTQEVQLIENKRAKVTKLRPVVEGTASTVTVQTSERNTLNEDVTWNSAVSTESSGFACVRSNARYHRFRANITGGFDHAQGIEVVDAAPAGRR